MKQKIGCTVFIFAGLYGILYWVFWHFPETRMLINTDATTEKLRKILSLDLNTRSSDVRHPKQTETQKSDKWIVVTTSGPLPGDTKYLARLPGWRVVIVGDKNTTNNWRYQNCDFLSMEQQEKLGFQITPILPVKSLSRKNVGYLYAIKNGAKLIYDTVIGNRAMGNLEGFSYSEEFTGLLYTGQNKTFNSYRHFGLSNLWPHGYPLNEIGENISYDYTLGTWRAPLIQHGLVNGDLGEDAIFRPMRKIKAVPSNVTFSINSPPVMVRSNAYSPFNSQNTLYRYDAFWGLFLPTTISVHVRDIWRSYWSQRLLWEIGGNIAFYPPKAYSKRNIYDNFEDAGLYFKTENLLKFLSDWTCKQKYSFFDCVLDLTFKMIEQKYLHTNDGKLISSWIDDLKSVNYIEPKRTYVNNTAIGTRKIKGQTADKRNTSIIFIPPKETPQFLSLSKEKNQMPKTSVNRILHLCPHFVLSRENISYISNVKRYDNILLIIVFNSPFYGSVKFLEAMYRAYFPNIVYCGIKRTLFEKMTIDLNERVSFIEIEIQKGYFAQRCMLQAMQMNYGVNGYLYIMDDLLLYTKQFSRFKLDKIMMSPVALLMEDKRPSPDWGWYHGRYGMRAYRKGLNALYNTSIKAHTRFKDNLRKNTGFKTGFFKRVSDIMYLPATYSEDFLFYMDIFTRHNLFLEIAIPTVLGGITKMENINFLHGTYLWGGGRRNALKKLAERKDFVHPVKLGRMDQKDICDKVIKPNLFG